jgi:hypothetical protein
MVGKISVLEILTTREGLRVRRGRYAVSVLQMTLVPQERELREIADRMGCVSPLPKTKPRWPRLAGLFRERHNSLPPPAFCECLHGLLARRGVAVCGRAILVVPGRCDGRH